MTERIRLAELLGALSFAGDLGRGQPMGHVLRTCRIAMAMGDKLGLGQDELGDVYYTSLLVHSGCTAGAPEFAAFLASDELRAQKDFCLCDPTSMTDLLGWLWRHVGEGRSMPARGARMLRLMAQGEKAFQEIDEGCSEVGSRIAARLGMSEGTQRSLYQVCENWAGKGPHRVKGEEIPLPARLVNVAMILEVFFSEEGVTAARQAARARSGKSFDPGMSVAAREVCADSSFWEGMQEQEPWESVLALEPQPHKWVGEAHLDEVCLAFADIVDLKSQGPLAHSRRTGELCAAIAGKLGIDEEQVALARRAGLVHDVGLVGVPAFLLSKERLSEVEFERYRLHPYFTERILSRSELTRNIGKIASTHHETLDGHGYHRGIAGTEMPLVARILSLACAYQERAARPDEKDAKAILSDLSGEPYDGACLAALEAELMGGTLRPTRPTWPVGLTDREVEVLRLVAGGRTLKQASDALVVSEHTVRHHLESIYSKAGVSSRAGVVLFAVENDLLT